MNKSITKTFWFKHINWGPGYDKPGRAAVEVTLTYKDKGPCLSISAMAYGWHAREPFMCGQCLEELESTSLKDNDLFQELYGYWKKWHLNDLHAGTPKQETCIDAAIQSGELPRYKYRAVRDLLDKKGLLIDCDYEYGTGWLYEPIPADVLARIETIINA